MSLSSVSLDPCHHSRLCERVFQKSSSSCPPTPTRLPSPTPTPTVWLMQTGIMADNGETKHSFSAVCDMKEGLHFFPLSLSPFFLFLQSGLLWVAPWVDCMWRGDVLTTGSLLIAACVHQNTEKFCARLNGCGLSPAHKGPLHWQCISIFLLPVLQCSKDSVLTPKCTVWFSSLQMFYLHGAFLLLTWHWRRVHINLSAVFLVFDPLICSIGDSHLNFPL